MTFDDAFRALLGHEGGYSDHAADPGGKTRYGVTEAVARQHGYTGDMRELPLAVAQAVYRKDYWDACHCDRLPAGVRYAVFDAAVNSGVRQSALWLQRACGAKPDGVIGPQTLLAANTHGADVLARRLLSQRLRFMTELKAWPAFSRGWARRVADLLEV